MPTVFIANLAVVLPVRFNPGDAIDDIASQLLNEIQHRRIKARLRYLLQKGEIDENELQVKANSLSEEDLVPYATQDDEMDDDPVYSEAISIARELIVGRMAQEGLPPPKGLDAHAKALVDGMPALMEQARLRIEARYRAATAAISQ